MYASDQRGGYVLNTVYLARALCFGGKVRGRPARTVIINLGIMPLLFGVYHVISLPMSGGLR